MSRWLPADIPVRGTDSILNEAPDRIAEAIAEPGCLGVVVAMDFSVSAELLSRLGSNTTPIPIPIVLTGAVIPPRSAGTDAPGNIADAIRVVCVEETESLGVLLVAEGRIHAAGEVRFEIGTRGLVPSSGPLGPIGLVSPKGVEIVRRPLDGAQLARRR